MEFETGVEMMLYEQVKALKEDRVRLLKKVDSLEQKNFKLSEIIRARKIRATLPIVSMGIPQMECT